VLGLGGAERGFVDYCGLPEKFVAASVARL
jgi:hypothetical protein